jgi:hypothetical protein
MGTKKREFIKAKLTLFAVLLLGAISLCFRVELFPISYYPMYSYLMLRGQKFPRAAVPLSNEYEALDLDLEDATGEPRFYVMIGVRKDGTLKQLVYSRYLGSLGRQAMWESFFRAGHERPDTDELLKKLFEAHRSGKDFEDLVGLRLVAFFVRFNDRIEAVRRHEKIPFQKMLIMGEYTEPHT